MMLTKEECKESLKVIISRGGGVEELLYWTCAMPDAINTLNSLIDEHFAMLDKLKTGDLSDGYHTFNELYHHRAVLFSVVINQNKEIAWKSKKHHDGTMYDGMFIVGIDTPNGQYSYHYDIDPYWNMFACKELDNAPEWDGHEPKDINRLLSIDDNPPLKWEELKEGMFVWDNKHHTYIKIDRIWESYNKAIYFYAIGWECCENTEYEPNRFYRKEVQDV